MHAFGLECPDENGNPSGILHGPAYSVVNFSTTAAGKVVRLLPSSRLHPFSRSNLLSYRV